MLALRLILASRQTAVRSPPQECCVILDKNVMNEIELTNKAIEWLERQDNCVKLRPHYFKPKEVADAVGGYAGTVGKVAKAVVAELCSRGINIRYVCSGSIRRFELLGKQH